ncbi:MAG: diguanylate cyclase [Coriobacteriales bacterium]|nr:diguanylate cyclase [Coriobacteriales bacterium]
MGFIYIAGLVVYAVSFGILLADLIIAVFTSKAKYVRFFIMLMFTSCVYALGFLLQHLAPDYLTLLQGGRVQYLGAVFVSPMMFLFVLDFCGVKIRAWLVALLLVIPVFTVALVYTYPLNGLYFGESSYTNDPVPLLLFSGSVFRTIYFLYSYIVMLAAFITCIVYRSKRDALFRRHSTFIIVSMAVPLIGNLLTAFLQLFPFDLTPFFASVTGTVIAYASLFTGVFKIAPLAREEIVENMQDGFVLIDPEGRFLDANLAAKRLFPELEHISVGLPMGDVGTILWNAEGQPTQEFSVETPSGRRYYRCSADSVTHKGHDICTCVTIYDNTSLQELMDEVTLLAEQDALTGLQNRRSFYRDAERKCEEIIRYGGKAFLLMFDIDYFKDVNDTYGHPAGDEVLRRISALLLQRFRKTDLVARFGGEEFCVFMPTPSEEMALEIAEECRQRVESLPIAFEGKTLYVTTSIGVAEFPSAQVQTLTTLIKFADDALYEAKHSGRNTVKIHRQQ